MVCTSDKGQGLEPRLEVGARREARVGEMGKVELKFNKTYLKSYM